MASSQVGFYWNERTLFSNLATARPKFQRAVHAAIEFQATKSEGYMKANAPWNDQTSNARNSLRTYPFHEGEGGGFHLAHGVPYGIFLEAKFSGRDGIIPQSVNQGGLELMSLLSKLLSALK